MDETINPFFATPEYLDIQRQLAEITSSTQQQREAYVRQVQALEDQYRSIGLLGALPAEQEQAIRNQLYNQYLQQNAEAINAQRNRANFFGGVAGQVSNFLQSARPGQTLQLPTNPYTRRFGGAMPSFVLEDPARPYTFEQRQAYQAQGLNPVNREYLQNYLNTELLPRQQELQAGLDTMFSPQTFQQQQQQAINERLAQELSGFRTAEQQRIEAQQQQLASQIRPVVDTAYTQQEALQRQLEDAQRAFAANRFAQQLGITPEQFIQQESQQVAQREAEGQAQVAASQDLDQQRLNYIFETGKIPTTVEEFPEELRAPAVQQVTAPTVPLPTLPQYSFLSAQQPQPTQQAAPVVQQPSLIAPPVVTQPATQPTAQPTTQQNLPVVAQQPIPVQQATPVTQPVTTSPSFLGGIPVGIGAQQPGTSTMATTPSLNPATLPELRSAGGGGTSAIDPTLRPYLELGLRAAEQQFLQTQPQFFPGQTYVSPSQQTLDALAAQEQIARSAPSSLQAAQESYMRGLGGLGATAGGAFLMGNPYQQMAIEAATRPIMQQYQEQTMPGIASGFSRAGRYGSGAMERAQGRAAEATGRAIGDVASNIAYSGYEAERGRQQQALTQQINAAQMAPQIYGQQFLPSQQLGQIGAAREAIAGLPLQEQMARFQFAQQAPAQQLQSFLSSIYGTPMAGSQYAPTPQTQTNRAGNVLGLAATGAGIGSMIGGNLGGFSSTAIGAGLGALGGLLS
jgi:hypothetical protein